MKYGIALTALLAAAPLVASAQQPLVGPQTGDKELTLSGSGSSDKNGDNATFGLSGDLGYYLTPDAEVGIRQSVNYSNPADANSAWNGATRGFVDYHFFHSAFRPFVGGSLGGIYGDNVNDSGFAGLEAGVKYYVRQKTFVTGRAEYQWFFDSANEADNQFNDGAWAYTVGLGYNF